MKRDDENGDVFLNILSRLKKSTFRAGFFLKNKEMQYLKDKGYDEIKKHAYDIIRKRISPAYPDNDGKQTPMRNHPVFIAQHATANCCRGCIEKWHHIPKGRELTENEIDFIVDLLMVWLDSQIKV